MKTVLRELAEALAGKGWKLATAESCTGGLIGGALTSVPGSSAWYLGGVVAYANEVKTALLGVPEEVLARHGAVSPQTARAMAQGVLERTGADVAVAVTGVARKLENMIGVVSQAISSAGGAMVSQALGRGKTERVSKVVYHALWIVAIPASVFALITWQRPEWLFGLFSNDAAVLEMAVSYVPVALVQYLGATLRPASFALINGSGNSRLNLAVALMDGIVSRIGLSLLLGVILGWGIRGFWYGNALSGLIPFLIGSVYLFSGRWKNKG